MRQENVRITIEIPLHYGKPDKNRNIYTKEAVKNAIDNFKPGCPLITGRNLETVIGSVDNIQLSNDENTMLINAIVFGSGTCEDVEDVEFNNDRLAIVKKYRITSCGLGE